MMLSLWKLPGANHCILGRVIPTRWQRETLVTHLAAMAARHGGDGDAKEARLAHANSIRNNELLRVHLPKGHNHPRHASRGYSRTQTITCGFSGAGLTHGNIYGGSACEVARENEESELQWTRCCWGA